MVLTATLWSLGGVLIKSVPLHPLAIAGVRSFIAAIVIAIYIRRFKFLWNWNQLASVFSFVCTVVLFVSATKLTTAANAILLQYTAPIYAAIFGAWILKEKVYFRDWLALAIVMLGMILFFVEAVAPQYVFGNCIALLSGVAFAGVAIFLKKQNGESVLESIFLGHVVTALVGLPFLLDGPMPTVHEGLLLTVLGVVQLGIPYILYGLAVKHVTALEATLIPVIEPILNPIWVFLFFGERPSGYALIGGTVVIGAVVVHSYLNLVKPVQKISAKFETP